MSFYLRRRYQTRFCNILKSVDALNFSCKGVSNNLALIKHFQNNQDTLGKKNTNLPCILCKQKRKISNHPLNLVVELLYSFMKKSYPLYN